MINNYISFRLEKKMNVNTADVSMRLKTRKLRKSRDDRVQLYM